MSQLDPKYIPNLPGFKSNKPSASSKKSSFKYINGYAMPLDAPSVSPDDVIEPPKIDPTLQYGVRASNKATTRRDEFNHVVDPEAGLKRQVLTFDAYVKEELKYSAQKERIRYMTIMYMCEDNTVSIFEQKVENSGCREGPILKKQKVSISDNGENRLLMPSDFNVAIDMKILGVTYRICCCSDMTAVCDGGDGGDDQDYLTRIGVRLNAPEETPEDKYLAQRDAASQASQLKSREHVYKPKDNLKRFLDSDGKVLRFFAEWDDRNSVFGDIRKFAIHYYIVDDSVELRELHSSNDGRDPVNVFVKRGRLSKSKFVPDIGSDIRDYFVATDFKLGSTIPVLGRQFYIVDCDEFTRTYLKTQCGVSDSELQAAPSLGDDSKLTKSMSRTRVQDEEVSVDAKAMPVMFVKKDPVKMVKHANDILRFKAELLTDKGRKFVVSFYYVDGTVQVYEEPMRNSGFKGGKFLDRRQVINPVTNSYFLPAEFYVGATVTIMSFTFTLTEADVFAIKFMERYEDDFPCSNLDAIVTKIRDSGVKVEVLYKAFTDEQDSQHVGCVTTSAMNRIMQQYCELSAHELITITRRFDPTDCGYPDYRELLAVLRK